jgi:acetoin utilization deacetylase AcuC-like enzyme
MTTVTTSKDGVKLMIVASDSLKIVETESGERSLELSMGDTRCDALDNFNHTRFRRASILNSLFQEQKTNKDKAFLESTTGIGWHPAPAASNLDFYKATHSQELLTFLLTAHDAWERLGPLGRDHSGCLAVSQTDRADASVCPPLVPINMPLARLPNIHQRPSQHVLGQMGYYCNDTCTPIFDQLSRELLEDAGVMHHAVQLAVQNETKSTIYAVPTHPGHHAAKDSFGGYCYVNHVAAMAKQLQKGLAKEGKDEVKIAILDVDYHCGNGTASILDDDLSVLLVSLHCEPDYDYPFHIGFVADDDDANQDASRTLHLPLPPTTKWPAYQVALEQGLDRINDFQPQALIVSMGLDTYAEDPCALRRAGFELQGRDYIEMGRLIGEHSFSIPTVIFVQEGGYRMDAVAKAATDVVTSCHTSRQG